MPTTCQFLLRGADDSTSCSAAVAADVPGIMGSLKVGWKLTCGRWDGWTDGGSDTGASFGAVRTGYDVKSVGMPSGRLAMVGWFVGGRWLGGAGTSSIANDGESDGSSLDSLTEGVSDGIWVVGALVGA